MRTFPTTPHDSNGPNVLTSQNFEQHLNSAVNNITDLVKKGGPMPSEYADFKKYMDQLALYRASGSLTPNHMNEIFNAFGESLSTETIQGFILHKPHGYAGDFEIIERIYNYYTATNPKLSNWDRFFHSQKAPKAVRNRVSYFLEQIWKIKNKHPDTARVLNIASGPGRDMYETLKVIGPSNIIFDCVDQDYQAIQYAKSLCHDFLSHIHFFHRNVFRFVPQEKYQLIWSAGLFDYFNDRLFKRVIKQLLPSLERNGKLVIGNFSEDNPTEGFMVLFDWILHHRSKEQLRVLAQECGVTPNNIWIEQEPEGVNLFLHIVKA